MPNRSRTNWSYHIAKQNKSGLTVAEYCRHERLSSWAFYANRKRFKGSNRTKKESIHTVTAVTPSSFVSIGTLHQADNSIIVTFTTGITVEIKGQHAGASLVELLRVLREDSTGSVLRC